MTDYAELCERLRARVPGWAMDRAANPDGREAADAIERLSAENEALRDGLRRASVDLAEARDMVRGWGAYVDPHFQEMHGLESDISRLSIAHIEARTTLKGADHD